MITKKQIEKWNSYFKSLSKAEKRVAVAKDVLLQIKNKKYTANSGSYIYFDNSYEDDEDIQANFNKVKCSVCALASAAMSCIKYTNNATFEDAYFERDIFWNQLTKVFSKKQLVLIEYAFEGYIEKNWAKSDEWRIELSNKEIIKTKNFYEKYIRSETGRLKAIMQNIVDNKGKFVI